MGIEATPKDYWIAPNAINITLNALGEANRIQGNASPGAVISCYMSDIAPGGENGDGLLLDNSRNPKRWPITISPTFFSTDTTKYVYAAIPRSQSIGSMAVIVFPGEKLDLYGVNSNNEQKGSIDYFYIFLQGEISAPMLPLGREWVSEIDWGSLGTYEDIIDVRNVDWYDYNNLTQLVTFLKDIAMSNDSSFRNINLNNKTLLSVAGNSTPIDSDTAVVTPQYVYNRFLRKDVPDTAAARITFGGGITVADTALIGAVMQTPDFLSDLAGWQIDSHGNAEVESMKIRSFLQVMELLINRLQAQEGDTLFTDSDQIESVEEITGGSTTTYLLSLKEKWEGYFTAQKQGNILRGIINTLAAKAAGISDYEGADGQGADRGGNLYYTSYMTVEQTHATAPALCGKNHVIVSLWDDDDVPAARNFPPCALMCVARWGALDPAPGASQAEVEDIRRRQTLFYLSASEGRIMKLTRMNKPTVETWNVGTSLGTLPEFVQQWGNVRDKVLAGRDYLYAQGIVYQDLIHVNMQGVPVPVDYDMGAWQTGVNYLYFGYSEERLQYERHTVTHRGCRWACRRNQPYGSTYVEPGWNTPEDWGLIEGNQNLSIEFVSTAGDKFRRDMVQTTLQPHIFYGNMDITEDIPASATAWQRETRSGKSTADQAWDAAHQGRVTGAKDLPLTTDDMPDGWSSANTAIFTFSAVINDGRNEQIIQNQIRI